MSKHLNYWKCILVWSVSIALYAFSLYVIYTSWPNYMRFGEFGSSAANRLAQLAISEQFRWKVVIQYIFFGIYAAVMYILFWMSSRFPFSEFDLGKLARMLRLDILCSLFSYMYSFYSVNFVIPGSELYLALSLMAIKGFCLLQGLILLYRLFSKKGFVSESNYLGSGNSSKRSRMLGVLLVFIINVQPTIDFLNKIFGFFDSVAFLQVLLSAPLEQLATANQFVLRTFYDYSVAIVIPLVLLICLGFNITYNAPLKIGVPYDTDSPNSHMYTLVTLKTRRK